MHVACLVRFLLTVVSCSVLTSLNNCGYLSQAKLPTAVQPLPYIPSSFRSRTGQHCHLDMVKLSKFNSKVTRKSASCYCNNTYNSRCKRMHAISWSRVCAHAVTRYVVLYYNPGPAIRTYTYVHRACRAGPIERYRRTLRALNCVARSILRARRA